MGPQTPRYLAAYKILDLNREPIIYFGFKDSEVQGHIISGEKLAVCLSNTSQSNENYANSIGVLLYKSLITRVSVPTAILHRCESRNTTHYAENTRELPCSLCTLHLFCKSWDIYQCHWQPRQWAWQRSVMRLKQQWRREQLPGRNALLATCVLWDQIILKTVGRGGRLAFMCCI
ncbi:hypothetical protein BDR03DRAFT_456909 [Suillus americanus]|nr:hypothetical protein BDR03DRAFT_456909 [Suillus americanus]